MENAISYSNDKVNITVEFLELERGGISIVVTDDGLGIPPQCVEHIFDLFFRASDLSTGSGLGLYMAKKSIERLGGEINVASVYGKGWKFTIVIPELNLTEN